MSNDIKRYDTKLNSNDGHMYEDSDGDYVLYEDHKKLIEQLDALQWIEITEDTKDIPDGVIFGAFSNDPESINPTHYYVPIEAGE